MSESYPDRVLRRAEVEHLTSLTERMLRNLEREGRFPRRFLITEGGRAVGWSANEVAAWLADRVERREQPNHRGIARRGQRIGRAAEQTTA